MKYLESLNKRGLSIENLPKSLQKKIKELEFQLSAYNEVNENDDLEESDLEQIKEIKVSIDDLDKIISHKINIFDQAKYEAKLDKVSNMTKAKQGIKLDEPEEPKKEIVKEVQQEPIQQPRPVQPAQPSPVKEPQISQEQQIAYDGGYEQEEQEEFEKVAEGKPKKMTTGLILMGVGAFFLTWGAVNFFKSRR
jgi:hypothetical protein